MAGGINAWNGVVAEGPYEAGLAYFPRASGPVEMISLSWALEEGNRAFYDGISRQAADEEEAALFRSLVLAEEKHKEILRGLHARIAGEGANLTPPAGIEAGGVVEGGIPVGEALAWARGKMTQEIVELAVAMEANSLDRYIKMGRSVGDEQSRGVFLALAAEEQAHLGRMTSLLDRLQGKG